MSKKLLSVVLALALVFSCFAVGAFALGSIGYESEEDAPNYTQAWALESTDNGNGTYTVKVKLTANYGVGSIQFKVLKTVNAGTIKLTAAAEGADIPENWVADVSFSDTTGEVAVIPHPDEDGVYAVDATDGIYVAELTYTVSNDANGSLVIDVADAKSESNPGGTLIAARMSDGNVVTGTSITGQTVSQDTNTVIIGKAVVEYTVSFNANGGAGTIADVTVEDGDSYTLPACTFTAPTGMKFAGWDVNGTIKAAGDAITVTADTTVKATWSAIMYTVSFAAGEGTGTMANQSVAHGSTYTLPACGFTAPSGYEFSAWSVNGAEKAVGDTITVTADTVVTAIWVKSIVPPTLAVIDGTNGVIDTSRTEMDAEDIDGDGDTQHVDGFLLGFDPDNNGSIEELFTVEGDGEMQIVATEAGSEAATGTMVNVVDLDGNVVATYVVIVFGDVNGDGVADGTDASNIEQHDFWILGDYGRLYYYQDFAGDVNADGISDGTDSSNIEQHDFWILGDLGRIDVAGVLAALGF